MPQLVSPLEVIPTNYAPSHTIRKMVKILREQGQIEPLQVKPAVSNKFQTFSLDAWGSEIVWAARHLGWSTILVHVTDKYEQ